MSNKIILPENLKGAELYQWLRTNKSMLVKQKKAAVKEADAVGSIYVSESGKLTATKEFSSTKEAAPVEAGLIQRKCVINTTNIFDSHDDVHIDGLWKKSLQMNELFYHIQEHQFNFKNIISDDVKAFTKKYSFRDLGGDFDGTTEALIFDSSIYESRNAFMYDQYLKGYVKNHSVGMCYVDLDMAINDPDFKEEFAIWNKYYDRIGNKDDLDNGYGYFWAITQAKVVEGSAVVKGSNFLTPTIGDSTKNLPAPATGEEPQLSFMEYIKQTKFINI